MKTIKEMIAVMQAADDGKKIEFTIHINDPVWEKVEEPHWDWAYNDYRVAVEKPLTVEENAKLERVWVPVPWADGGVSPVYSPYLCALCAKRGEAYATKEGALAEAERRWGKL